ncbi:MAG: ATP-binding protein [bacterium]|nr:ATP-binding protein [bacterium]
MPVHETIIDQTRLFDTAELSNSQGNHAWIRELIKFGVITNQIARDRFKTETLYKTMNEFLGRSRGEVICIRETLQPYRLGMIQPALESVLKDYTHAFHIEFDPSSDPIEQGYIAIKTDWNTTQLALQMAIDGWITADGHRILTRYITERRWDVINNYTINPILSIFALPDQIRLAEQIMKQLIQWMKDHNYYRRKKITAEGEFLSIERKYTWDDIILDPAIKQEIIENVVDFIKYIPIYQANRIPTKRGLIFYGKPGVGKTLVGKVLASQVDSTFIWVTAAKIKNAESVTQLFQFARELQPSIVFIEDLDCFAIDRHIHFTPILGELLNQMDGIVENEGVIVIATTNDLQVIEPALKDRPSRFDRVLEFKLPDVELRKQIIMQALRGKTANGINIDRIAEKTEGFTGAHLHELVILATKVAIEQKDYDESNIVKLTDTHFELALNQVQKKKEKALGFYIL